MLKRICLFLICMVFSLCIVFQAFAADPVPVERITLEPASAVVSVGKTLNVKAVIEPKNATAKKPE